eukprot:CAMPEP_0177267594 /NCGR_PEP_ID=MMETSP0367-20130122/63344_1 /TAXON_ID=447022 ORGANISM="Scrippsiella hangoei-like, Strain SHHI-4" /NCGR_SAMPLE_ID=MMETSP0367 /ASSEMBLY_ACC=CAM_ASM_000362 /LENGTH=100 /DNA_ID=CAMNT_0018723127 /DNA_START=9 /DNA_END=311 /DNA_ORIENTATION=+
MLHQASSFQAPRTTQPTKPMTNWAPTTAKPVRNTGSGDGWRAFSKPLMWPEVLPGEYHDIQPRSGRRGPCVLRGAVDEEAFALDFDAAHLDTGALDGAEL